MGLPAVGSKEELAALVEEVGFLPVFANHIPGFSVEECIDPACWFPDQGEGFWEWKRPVIQASGCAYGKFLRGRACFVTLEWYLELANYRRAGYDFDARYDDGLVRGKDKLVFDRLWAEPSQLSTDLRRAAGVKDFEAVMTRLQMLGYVVIRDFEYRTDKSGKPYGWGITRYETPERRFGAAFTGAVYRHSPAESRDWLSAHFRALLPQAAEGDIQKLIG